MVALFPIIRNSSGSEFKGSVDIKQVLKHSDNLCESLIYAWGARGREFKSRRPDQ